MLATMLPLRFFVLAGVITDATFGTLVAGFLAFINHWLSLYLLLNNDRTLHLLFWSVLITLGTRLSNLFDSSAGGPDQRFSLLYYIIFRNASHLINVKTTCTPHSLLIYLHLTLVQCLRFLVCRLRFFCPIGRNSYSFIIKFILSMVCEHVLEEQRRAIAR